MPDSNGNGRIGWSLEGLATRVLDRDGDLYGTDERERTRWYEGIALGASLHWLLLPWTLAVLVWFTGAATAHALLLVMALTLLPLQVMHMHARAGGVPVESARWSRGVTALTIAYALPYPVFLAGYLGATGIGYGGAARGAITAGAAVLVLTLIGILLGRRRGSPKTRQ